MMPLERRTGARQATAICLPEYRWMDNRFQQTPCQVALIAFGACEKNGDYNIEPLIQGSQYLSPTPEGANVCACSWVAYNLQAACSVCQDRLDGFDGWDPYRLHCDPTPADTYWPRNVSFPTYSSFPAWAVQDPGTWPNHRFDYTTAISINNQGLPDLGAPPSKSNKQSVPIGAIAGGVVGGIILLSLAAFAGWLFYKRRRKQRRNNIRPNLDAGSTNSHLPQSPIYADYANGHPEMHQSPLAFDPYRFSPSNSPPPMDDLSPRHGYHHRGGSVPYQNIAMTQQRQNYPNQRFSINPLNPVLIGDDHQVTQPFLSSTSPPPVSTGQNSPTTGHLPGSSTDMGAVPPGSRRPSEDSGRPRMNAPGYDTTILQDLTTRPRGRGRRSSSQGRESTFTTTPGSNVHPGRMSTRHGGHGYSHGTRPSDTSLQIVSTSRPPVSGPRSASQTPSTRPSLDGTHYSNGSSAVMAGSLITNTAGGTVEVPGSNAPMPPSTTSHNRNTTTNRANRNNAFPLPPGAGMGLPPGAAAPGSRSAAPAVDTQSDEFDTNSAMADYDPLQPTLIGGPRRPHFVTNPDARSVNTSNRESPPAYDI